MPLTTAQIVAVWAFHSLVAFGLWYAVGKSKISQPFRELWADWHFHTQGGMVLCPGCNQKSSALNTYTERGYLCPGCKGECERIAKPDPFLLQMIECPACFGFWEGAFYSFTVNTLIWGAPYGLFLAPAFGCATLATNLILAKNTGLME